MKRKIIDLLDKISDINISESNRFRDYCLYESELYHKLSRINKLERSILNEIRSDIFNEWFIYICKFPCLLSENIDKYNIETFNIDHIRYINRAISSMGIESYKICLRSYCAYIIYNNTITPYYFNVGNILEFEKYINNSIIDHDKFVNTEGMVYSPSIYDINIFCGSIYYIGKSDELNYVNNKK